MSIQVEGLQEVLDKIASVADDELKRDLAYNYGQDLWDDMKKYPPESDANRPGGKYSWYQRGYGTKTRTGKGYKTSERLDQQWELVRTRKGAELKNEASYARYPYDKDKQPWFHRARGWPTWQDTAKKNRDKYMRRAVTAIERHISKA